MANSKVIDLAALATFKTLQDLANAATFVRKDGDKVLSTNDFTDEYKAQLDELTANLGSYQVATDAQVNFMLAQVFAKSAASRILSTCWEQRRTSRYPKSVLNAPVNSLRALTLTGRVFTRRLRTVARGSFMSTFATAVSEAISSGGIDMWQIVMLAATDPFGNSVAIGGNEVTIAAFAKDGKRISRIIKYEALKTTSKTANTAFTLRAAE